jgi:hypothetical protein
MRILSKGGYQQGLAEGVQPESRSGVGLERVNWEADSTTNTLTSRAEAEGLKKRWRPRANRANPKVRMKRIKTYLRPKKEKSRVKRMLIRMQVVRGK